MNLFRCCLTLSTILVFSNLLGAQTLGNSGFYIDFTGHALFPHAPTPQANNTGLTAGLDTGAGLTAAFGYVFEGGFSTEVEWGFQQVGIGNPKENGVLSAGGFAGIAWVGGSFGFPSVGGLTGFDEDPAFVPFPFSVQIDGKIQNQSLMANLYYRHPAWRVSPYAGFGAGTFFYDGTVETRLETDPAAFLGDVRIGVGPETTSLLGTTSLPLTTMIQSEERRFAYQLMAGLSFRVRQRVELRIGYRFRSGRSGPINSDQVEGGVRFRF